MNYTQRGHKLRCEKRHEKAQRAWTELRGHYIDLVRWNGKSKPE